MKKILLAVDGSTYSEEAAWLLSHLGRNEGYELLIVTALEGAHRYRNYAGRSWLNMLHGYERSTAEKSHQHVEEMFDGADVQTRSIIRDGNAAHAILDLAAEEGVDLIVLGAKGHSAISRLVLGSTSDRVAAHAPCSVLVVRPTQLRERGNSIRIAACYESDTPAESALEEVANFRWGPDTDIRVVTVCSHLAQAVDRSFRSNSVKAAATAARSLQDRFPKAHAEVVENEHIGDGLVRYLRDEQCDLAIVGETPRTRVERAIVGSVSRFVLRHSDCSVWVARETTADANEAQDSQVASVD